MYKYKGKVVLVTGGAQGIGAGIAEMLYKYGAHIVIADIQAEKAESLIDNIKNKQQEILLIDSDISTEEGCKHFLNVIENKFQCLDVVINNAAPSRNKEFINCLTIDDWERHCNLVLQTVVWLTKYAEPYLKKAHSAAIVNISSVTAKKVALEQCGLSYHVSKSGLEQLTRYLACRLGVYNIRVNAVAPGLVDREGGVKISEIVGNDKIIDNIVPLKRAGSASEIASVVAFLGSSEASYLTGQVITVDGGLGLLDGFSAALKLSD
jgi:NAD(P)-dependent dehydrogenase (short-subunit alcohol dehydrogenase family)